jgi:hypothetical protein
MRKKSTVRDEGGRKGSTARSSKEGPFKEEMDFMTSTLLRQKVSFSIPNNSLQIY